MFAIYLIVLILCKFYDEYRLVNYMWHEVIYFGRKMYYSSAGVDKNAVIISTSWFIKYIIQWISLSKVCHPPFCGTRGYRTLPPPIGTPLM